MVWLFTYIYQECEQRFAADDLSRQCFDGFCFKSSLWVKATKRGINHVLFIVVSCLPVPLVKHVAGSVATCADP